MGEKLPTVKMDHNVQGCLSGCGLMLMWPIIGCGLVYWLINNVTVVAGG